MGVDVQAGTVVGILGPEVVTNHVVHLVLANPVGVHLVDGLGVGLWVVGWVDGEGGQVGGWVGREEERRTWEALKTAFHSLLKILSEQQKSTQQPLKRSGAWPRPSPSPRKTKRFSSSDRPAGKA